MFSHQNFTVIRRACLEAGDAIMEIYGKDDFGVSSKSDQSPVTAADLAADKIILAALSEQFPDILIVTEENTDSHKQKADRFFIVDPLDGTKEFIKRGGDFTVNIGFVDNGAPIFGMVYAPAKERLFYTRDGLAYEEFGPFDKEKIGKTSQIQVRASDNQALSVVASASHRDQATDDYISKYEVADFRAAGSSMKFCLVASGEADFYPRLGPTMEWDTAAADAVTRAAGGEVLDFETKAPLRYGKADFRNPFFLVKSSGVELKA